MSAQIGLSLSGAIERRVMRRITWRLIPFLMICYFVAYLDRVNISFAALQMNKDIGLSASSYGLGAGLFFVTYCLLEVPSNLALYRVGATRWIARIMFTWGLCAGAMALVTGPLGFYVVRLLFGAAEAGFYPGMLFFLTLWFPATYRGRILGLAMAAIPISGIIGSPLSGYLLTLDGLAGLRGWQWLFLIEALPAILLAPMVLIVLKDGPAHAGWLPPEERDWLVGALESEARAVEDQKSYSVRQALTHPWVLFLAVVYFSNVCLLNGVQFFLPQIVKNFGLTDVQTGFVVAGPSLLALVTLILYGRRSDARQERYGHAAVANMIAALALLAAMLINDPVARMVLIAVAWAFTISFSPVFWSIPSTFLSRGAAAGGIAAISGLGVTGGVVSPWLVGHTRDLTGDFRFGLGAIAIFALLVAIPFFILGRRRQARDRRTFPTFNSRTIEP